jgi:hypothetical protein
VTAASAGKGVPLLEARYRLRLLLGLSAVFLLGTSLLHRILFVVFSREIAGDYAAALHALRHFSGLAGPVIAISVLAYVLAMCGATVVLVSYFLCTVAGPVYRIERALEACLSGDPVRPVFFRHGDQAQTLAVSFNAFLRTLREDRQKWMGVLEHAERLCLQDQATCRAEMERALSDLDRLLSKYR